MISLADFGVKPDSGQDAQLAMRQAIEAAWLVDGPVILDCPTGSYEFYSNEALTEPYYISNTASEEENPSVLKTIGILLQGMSNIILEGNGSLFVFHGKQTMITLDNCSDVEIRNLHMDYAQPTVVEMTIVGRSSHYIDLRVHHDARYEIRDGKLLWVGDGWSFWGGPLQTYDPVSNTTWRIDNWIEQGEQAEEIEQGLVRLYFKDDPSVTVGHVLQMRDGIRDQVGAFIWRSTNISFVNAGIHFMHGLGIVSQFSENLTFQQLELSPREDTGRTVTGFADLIHVSGCRGKVIIADSKFIGAHDDAINVHGTYLRIMESEANTLKVRFMHGQTYGFQPFYPGDDIDFVRANSLTTFGSNKVIAVEQLSPREWLLTLDQPTPNDIGQHDVIENVTWTPEVEIRNNYFARIPTRGILVTTRRKVVIAHNLFERTYMSAISIAVDAESWYESGRVEDVLITGNRFVACGNSELPVIFICPENSSVELDSPVHRNITIENNRFEIIDAKVLSAKSTRHLKFKHNHIVTVSPLSPEDVMTLMACNEVEIAHNQITTEHGSTT